MRVPSPAAMMTTVGADTARIVVSGYRASASTRSIGEWCNGSTGRFGRSGSGSSPGSPALGSVRGEYEHVFVPPRSRRPKLVPRSPPRFSCAEALRTPGYPLGGGTGKRLQRCAKENCADPGRSPSTLRRPTAPGSVQVAPVGARFEEMLVERSTHLRRGAFPSGASMRPA